MCSDVWCFCRNFFFSSHLSYERREQKVNSYSFDSLMRMDKIIDEDTHQILFLFMFYWSEEPSWSEYRLHLDETLSDWPRAPRTLVHRRLNCLLSWQQNTWFQKNLNRKKNLSDENFQTKSKQNCTMSWIPYCEWADINFVTVVL